MANDDVINRDLSEILERHDRYMDQQSQLQAQQSQLQAQQSQLRSSRTAWEEHVQSRCSRYQEDLDNMRHKDLADQKVAEEIELSRQSAHREQNILAKQATKLKKRMLDADEEDKGLEKRVKILDDQRESMKRESRIAREELEKLEVDLDSKTKQLCDITALLKTSDDQQRTNAMAQKELGVKIDILKGQLAKYRDKMGLELESHQPTSNIFPSLPVTTLPPDISYASGDTANIPPRPTSALDVSPQQLLGVDDVSRPQQAGDPTEQELTIVIPGISQPNSSNGDGRGSNNHFENVYTHLQRSITFEEVHAAGVADPSKRQQIVRWPKNSDQFIVLTCLEHGKLFGLKKRRALQGAARHLAGPGHNRRKIENDAAQEFGYVVLGCDAEKMERHNRGDNCFAE